MKNNITDTDHVIESINKYFIASKPWFWVQRCSRHITRACLAFLVVCLVNSNTVAQQAVIIPEVKGEINLDGIINEAAWMGAVQFQLVMHTPNNNVKPSESTTAYMLYDERYLYVGSLMSDSEANKIQSPTKKRDDLGLNNDWFGVFLDTFNDKENALAFMTTPAGLRTDYQTYNDAQGGFPINVDWNTFWDVAVDQNEDGWSIEMRIPISSLRFQDQNGKVTMGLTILRYVARKVEWSTYPNISNQWGFWSPFKPSQSIEITFENLKSVKPLYVAPYLLSGLTQRNLLNDQKSSYDMDNTSKFEPG